jgi:hypothetical protein
VRPVHDESDDIYGARRVHAELADQGRRHSGKRIARLMRAAGQRGRTPKRWRTTTVPCPTTTPPASSSFQAGPGLLKALSQHRRPDGTIASVLPAWLGTNNRHHTPFRPVIVFAVVSAAGTAAADARDQGLVLVYPVAVFLSFLAGLIAMATFSHRDGHKRALVVNLVAAIGLAFTVAVNLSRGDPIASLAASLLIAAGLYAEGLRAGRPGGIRNVGARAETSADA